MDCRALVWKNKKVKMVCVYGVLKKINYVIIVDPMVTFKKSCDQRVTF